MRLHVIASYGQPRRRDRVRVIRLTIKGEPMVRVQWKEGDRRRNQSFPDTRKGQVEAKAFAQEKSDLLAAKQVQPDYRFVTLRQLYERYLTAKADEWRPNTIRLSKSRWQKFELFAGKTTPAHLFTRERLDDFKRIMLESHSPNQVAHCIKHAVGVFRFGVDRDLIPPTKILSYRVKFGKDVQRQIVMGEYSATERQKIIAELDPKSSRHWRAWSLCTVFAYLAPRQRATRHLEWRDVELHQSGGSITWRKELDKMGNERVTDFGEEVAAAFWVALGWREKDGYSGPFVFYAVKERAQENQPYTYQAYSHALRSAETRAGIKHMKYRGAHGFRRGVSGDVYDVTGSEHKAAEYIGDKSVKVVKRHYLLARRERMSEIASLVAGKMQPKASKTENATVEGGDGEG